MSFLLDGFRAVTWQQGVMYLVGFALIYLAIQKDYEPALLLPMGFGAILVNLPSSGVLNQMVEGIGESQGIIQWLFETTIEASEALPLLLFIGIGAMIDFGPLLSNPKMLLFGAAAQFGIFFTMVAAVLLGFDLADAASIGIIGAADGPTSILVSQVLHSSYVGPIAVAAYSYMALVPIIQPFAIKLVTTKKERRIRMPYNPKNVSRTLRICFPILVTIIAGFIAPMSVSLVGFLMFGNLLRECGCLDRLSETAQNTLANLITLLLAFIEKCGFAAMHIFPYSIRPGPKAAAMAQVDMSVREERAARAAAVAERMHQGYLARCVGKSFPVLFEQDRGEGSVGHAPNYMPVTVGMKGLHNTVQNVRITAVDGDGLRGEPEET